MSRVMRGDDEWIRGPQNAYDRTGKKARELANVARPYVQAAIRKTRNGIRKVVRGGMSRSAPPQKKKTIVGRAMNRARRVGSWARSLGQLPSGMLKRAKALAAKLPKRLPAGLVAQAKALAGKAASATSIKVVVALLVLMAVRKGVKAYRASRRRAPVITSNANKNTDDRTTY